MQFTEIDVTVCLIVSVCMLIAFLLGGARTITGIGKWIATVLITLLFYPAALKYAEGRFTNPLMGNVATVVVLFTGSLIVCTLLAIGIMTILGTFKGSFTDRLFGLLIGFGLGALIVSGMQFMLVFAHDGKAPQWLKEGQTYKYTSQGAKYFDQLAGHLLKDASAKLKAQQDKIAKEAEEKAQRAANAGNAAIEALDEADHVIHEETISPSSSGADDAAAPEESSEEHPEESQ